MMEPNIVGWKCFQHKPRHGELLMAGINNRNFTERNSFGHIVKQLQYKPFFYFGPVVHRHAHPTLGNPHGIWTFKSLQKARNQGYTREPFHIIAKVGVFGKVIEYENIYRSSHIVFLHIYCADTQSHTHVNAGAMSKRYQCPVDVRVTEIEGVKLEREQNFA